MDTNGGARAATRRSERRTAAGLVYKHFLRPWITNPSKSFGPRVREKKWKRNGKEKANKQGFKQNAHRYSRFGRKKRAQATRLERNDGSNVTASGLGLNSHYTTLGRAHSTVRTSQDCVPRTYRRMRERWCLAHIRKAPGQPQAPTSSCQLRVANLTWSTLLKSQQASRQLLAQHEAGGRYLPFSISTMPIRAVHWVS